MFGHVGAQRAGVGDRLFQPVGVDVGEVDLGALASQAQRALMASHLGGITNRPLQQLRVEPPDLFTHNTVSALATMVDRCPRP